MAPRKSGSRGGKSRILSPSCVGGREGKKVTMEKIRGNSRKQRKTEPGIKGGRSPENERWTDSAIGRNPWRIPR